jgi:hypothetical protein
MARRFLLVATAAALVAAVPAGAGAQTAAPPSAYLAPGTYAGTELKGFTARDAQQLYTDALKQGCSNAADVDAALAKGPPSGNGVLLGTTDGRIVVSESILAFPNAKTARQFVSTARSSSSCVGYGGRDSFNRVFVQYPQPPPLPTFAPTVARDGTTSSAIFEGKTDAAPLAGSTALIAWDHFVAETSIRIAVPKPGELTALSQSVWDSASYDGRSATGVAADPKVAEQADSLAQAFLASPASAPYAFAPAARTGLPANPPSCKAATDAYVYAGVSGAVRGFTGRDDATAITARPEIIVFPKETGTDRYLAYARGLTKCLTALYQGGLPAGSTVEVQRSPKRGTASLAKGSAAKTVAYFSTLKGPDGVQIGKTAVEVITARNHAASLVGQVVSGDATINLQEQLNPLALDLGAVLSQK